MTDKRKKLTARWSKRENDIVFAYPDHSWNGALLYSYLGGHGVKDEKGDAIKLWDELERRGYDKTTLRFSISKKVIP
jgi:hypothetical protein